MKIGFFDSGIGGLSVLHLALKHLPNEQFLFYADTEHVPYGEKSIGQIIEYTDRAVGFMIQKGVKAVVIACNTATSAAIAEVRNKYPIPIIGMEPAVKKALDLCPGQRVFVAATPITVKGKKLESLINRVDHNHLTDLIALPELVRCAERGELASDAISRLLHSRFSQFGLRDYSALVLGCTHFNYFKETFRNILPGHIRLVDGNAGTVRRLVSELERLNSPEQNPPSIEYYYSGQKVETGGELSRIETYLRHLDSMLEIT